jgi:hypothetical protein
VVASVVGSGLDDVTRPPMTLGGSDNVIGQP